MSVFTCIACRVVFADGATQRAHYKTDWHRYNLKRKVADLPPVTAENFKQRVLTAQQSQNVPDEKRNLKCDLCGKTFSTQNALQNHLQSKKHKEAESKEEFRAKRDVKERNEKNKEKQNQLSADSTKLMKDQTNKGLKGQEPQPLAGATAGACDEEMEDIETDSEVESVESFGDEDGLGMEECLFCSLVGQSLEENLNHMTVKHGFFLPDAEYLTDLEGLITYLGQKVGFGNLCLWCNEKGKRFQSTQAVQKHMVDKGHCKMLHEGDTLLEYADFYDYRSSYPDHNPDAEDQDDDMETDEVNPEELAAEGFELVLPSGSVIGHRSLQRYYKQNPNPRFSGERSKSILPKMLAQYKALGWTGATGTVAEKRCKDLAAVQRIKSQFRLKMGMKANKFQPHYRPQVVF